MKKRSKKSISPLPLKTPCKSNETDSETGGGELCLLDEQKKVRFDAFYVPRAHWGNEEGRMKNAETPGFKNSSFHVRLYSGLSR
jgi:hypothetical protein